MGDRGNIVVEGHHVVLKKDNVLKLVVAKSGGQGRFGKVFFKTDSIVGHPFGSVFEIQKDGTLTLSTEEVPDVMVTEVDVAPTGDNREINDSGEGQRLVADDITRLKEEGVKGEEIIQQLVANSETFQQKTEFSQAKYLKKKQRKYLQLVTVLRPCTRLIAQLFFDRSQAKIMQLRVDSLAQLLVQANVQSGARMLVADTCQGLVVGAVVSRMGAAGEVVHLYTGDRTAVGAFDAYNFTAEQRAMVQSWPLDMLQQVAACAQDDPSEDVEVAELMARKAKAACQGEGEGEGQGEWDAVHEERVVRRVTMRKARRVVAQTLAAGGYDGLVVATKYQPLQVVQALLPYLDASRPFAVYFPYKEPLVEAYLALKAAGGTVRLNVFETWTRPYQVLPLRTHPEMMMNANSGYVLTGIKVTSTNDRPPGVTQPFRGNKQKRARRR